MTDAPNDEREPLCFSSAAPITFAGFAALGYARLCPIIPPDAAPGPRLAERIERGNDARGKMPGIRHLGEDGFYWTGVDFTKIEPTSLDLGRWQNMGAGIGIKTGLLDGKTIVLIDADTMNPKNAAMIAGLVMQHFGELPTRIGQAPKAGYLIAIEGAFKYMRVEFGNRDAKGRLIDRVEILAEGRQFVAYGIHPKTKAPYRWTLPLVPLENLTTITPETMLSFMRALQKLLPSAKPLIQEGGGAPVDQEKLKGKQDHVSAAVRATPNTTEHFPTREAWRDYGYAIKGATQDYPEAGLELFVDWSDRWADDTNALGYAESEWQRMQPPFRVGVSKLYEIADKIGDGSFTSAMAWFDVIEDSDSPFDVIERREAALQQTKALTPIEWADPSQWDDIPLPSREWEVEGWIPKGEVTLLYGDGGIGKTLIAHQYATAAAAGVPWLGQPTRQAKVMCFFCEDSREEIQRRQRDINRLLGVTGADIAGRLRISCRRFQDNLLALWDRNSGGMKRTAVWDQICRDAKAFAATVVIVDTLADVYSGNEIDRAQVTAFVKSCLGRLAHEIEGSVIVLGHPSLSGKSSGTGTSGSTAWSNAVRSRLYLRYPDKQTTGDIREIESMKMNYGPKGGLVKLRWVRGAFETIGASVIPLTEKHGGRALEKGEPGFVARPSKALGSLNEQCDNAVMAALVSLPVEPLNVRSPTSKHFAPRILKTLHPDGVFASYSQANIEASINRLLKCGRVETVEVGRTLHRKPIIGLRLTSRSNIASAQSQAMNVFN